MTPAHTIALRALCAQLEQDDLCDLCEALRETVSDDLRRIRSYCATSVRGRDDWDAANLAAWAGGELDAGVRMCLAADTHAEQVVQVMRCAEAAASIDDAAIDAVLRDFAGRPSLAERRSEADRLFERHLIPRAEWELRMREIDMTIEPVPKHYVTATVPREVALMTRRHTYGLLAIAQRHPHLLLALHRAAMEIVRSTPHVWPQVRPLTTERRQTRPHHSRFGDLTTT